MVGRLVVVAVLLLTAATATPSVNYNETGTAELYNGKNLGRELLISTGSSFEILVPEGVNISNNKLQFHPTFSIGGVEYLYRRDIQLNETAGVIRITSLPQALVVIQHDVENMAEFCIYEGLEVNNIGKV